MYPDDESQDRIEYIIRIVKKLELCQSSLLPTVTEQNLFEEALRHVVHVASSKEGTLRCDFGRCSTTQDRKHRLEKILHQLCRLERKRLYEPPADNEIGYYLLLKKYTRSIVAFHAAASREDTGDSLFGSISQFQTLHHAEEIIEVNKYLADLSEFLWEVDIQDVSTFTPLMGTKGSYEMVPVIRGSKDRSYMFYNHKFRLALTDLKSSEFAYCPPFEVEEKSYLQVLDGISSPLIGPEDEMNVYSEELFGLYLERIYQDIEDIEGHLEKIICWILKKLSLRDWWETGKGHFTKQIFSFRFGFIVDVEDQEEYENYVLAELAKFKKELTKNCEVSNKDLPDFISQIDHCLFIVKFVKTIISKLSDYYFSTLKIFESHPSKKQAGWEAIHGLTLFKHDFPIGSVLQDQPMLSNPPGHVSSKNDQATRQPELIIHKQGEDENVLILKGVVDDLISIGDSNIVLDKEERALVHKIWGSVASSIHFYVSAMAYQQRFDIQQHKRPFDLTMLRLPAAKTKGTVSVNTIYKKQWAVENTIIGFAKILEVYKIGLSEKVGSSSSAIYNFDLDFFDSD